MQRMASLSIRAKIEESVKGVLEQPIREEKKSIGALCTHGRCGSRSFGSFDEVCKRKVMKEWSKAESAQSGCKLDTTKACSSSRMTKMAANLGCKRGFVVDLTTVDENDRKRDLSDFEIQKQADGKLREEAPCVLALSLLFTMFATIQSLNFRRQSDKKVMAHIGCAVKRFLTQAKVCRKFMIEQLVNASARRTQVTNKLLFVNGAAMVNFDLCMTGEEENEHHQQLAGAAHGVDDVPGAWRTSARHNAEVEGHGMPGVLRRVLQHRVRDHHEGEEQCRQHIGLSVAGCRWDPLMPRTSRARSTS